MKKKKIKQLKKELFKIIDINSGFDGIRNEKPIWNWVETKLIPEVEAKQKDEIIEELEKMKPDDVYDGAVVIRTLNQAIKMIKEMRR